MCLIMLYHSKNDPYFAHLLRGQIFLNFACLWSKTSLAIYQAIYQAYNRKVAGANDQLKSNHYLLEYSVVAEQHSVVFWHIMKFVS